MTLASARWMMVFGPPWPSDEVSRSHGCSRRVGVGPPAAADDCPMFGRTIARNMANPVEKNMPDTWSVKKNKEKGVKWKAVLGGNAFGGPSIAGGRIFVGTNNDKPRDPTINGDKGVVMCFNEADGKFLWQIVHDKLGNDAHDYNEQGVASTPAVDGDRLYYVSNRCELVCADVAGDPAAKGKGKIVWSLDMIKELKVSPGRAGRLPRQLLAAGPRRLVYVVTSNGVDRTPASPPRRTLPASWPSTRRPARWPGRATCPARTSWTANGPTRPRPWSTASSRSSSPAATAGCTASSQDGRTALEVRLQPQEVRIQAGGRRGHAQLPRRHAGRRWTARSISASAASRTPAPASAICGASTSRRSRRTRTRTCRRSTTISTPRRRSTRTPAWSGTSAAPSIPKPADGSREYVFGRTVSTVAVHDGLVYAAELDGFLHCLDAQDRQRILAARPRRRHLGFALLRGRQGVHGRGRRRPVVFNAGKEDKEPIKIDMGQSMKGPARGGQRRAVRQQRLHAVRDCPK